MDFVSWEITFISYFNPVRAGLVKAPEDYPWSGHNAYTGVTEISWLTQDWILNKFDPYETSARTLYREFIRKGIGETTRTEFSFGCRDGRFLGDDMFIEQVTAEIKIKSGQATLISLECFIKIIADVVKISISSLSSQAKKSEIVRGRGIAALLAREIPHLSIVELAKFLNKTPNALSHLAGLTEQRAKNDQELSKIIESVRYQLSSLTLNE